MVSKKLTLTNKTGLHARPASNFVKETSKYKCSVIMVVAGKQYNAKSILAVLSACVKCTTEIEIVCDGVDEQEALEGIVSAVQSGLGE